VSDSSLCCFIWTDSGTIGSNRPYNLQIAQITAELGCRWDDDCEEIVDAFLAQSNCDPGRALRYGKLLRDLGNVLKSHECVELRSTLSNRWPEADYVLCKEAAKTVAQQVIADQSKHPSPAPIERYRILGDVVADFFATPTDDETSYEGRRPALFEMFSQQVDQEIRDMEESSPDGLQLESARTDLLDTVKRVALTLMNPDLIALDADLEHRFFALDRAAKRYGVEKPSDVAAEGWLAYVSPGNACLVDVADPDHISPVFTPLR